MVDLLEVDLAGMSRGYMRKGCSEGRHVSCEVGMGDELKDGYMIEQRDSWLEVMEEDCKVLGWELGHDVANEEERRGQLRWLLYVSMTGLMVLSKEQQWAASMARRLSWWLRGRKYTSLPILQEWMCPFHFFNVRTLIRSECFGTNHSNTDRIFLKYLLSTSPKHLQTLDNVVHTKRLHLLNHWYDRIYFDMNVQLKSGWQSCFIELGGGEPCVDGV